MYKIKFTAAFKKSYKLMKKRGLNLNLLDQVISTISQGKRKTEFVRLKTSHPIATC